MTSIQKTITFPAKKRFLTRFQAKHEEKENNATVNDEETSSLVNPVKRSSSEGTVSENSCSPPKSIKNELSEELLTNIHSNEDEDLSQAIRVLHSSQPDKLYQRHDKIDKISELLLKALELRDSTSIYISGPPGTGKTACINHIISQSSISDNYKIVYVNCTGLKSANAAFKRIASELNIKVGTSEKKILDSIQKYLKSTQKMIMLILDEMDQLESKKQTLLYTIFEWPLIYKSNLVLLGIANALDLTDRILPRLEAKLDVLPILINFPPYSREEICEILTNRLKEGGVDNVLKGGALQLLASKVAAVSGDLRKALDIGRRVLEITQSKSESSKQVSLQDVLSVVNNVYGTSSTLTGSTNSESGESFPLHQKVLICTMILIKKNSKCKEITVGRLHDVYKKVCAKKNMTAIEISEFFCLSELVESRGAIKIQGKTRNRLSKG
ncbi:cell division control protein 6 homolog isoform X2 [Halyomorpha halys]|uniref:cell division control protein 6 homolog isoform X2 n=1 Tax=Halyomorpha halys TaxID=286706 RepID=UPI0006D4E859|nr:cell division control protein 6 homolog isoform X2 [Halyomorpha halys]